MTNKQGNIENGKKKYVTLKNGGIDFRKISKVMSAAGYKMNHATARNQLILAVETLIQHMSANFKTRHTKKDIQQLVESQDVHNELSDVILRAYQEICAEEEKIDKKK